METNDLIIERNKTHGDFRMNAKVSQALKNVITNAQVETGLSLTEVQQECLDMICLKISRICSGQAGHADHWADIAGYAKLAENSGRKPEPELPLFGHHMRANTRGTAYNGTTGE